MAIGDDFDINRTTRVIDYTGAAHGASGAGYYSGIAFHRWLQDLADDTSATPDDYMSIVFQNPSDRQGTDYIIQMLNGYTITQAAAEHLFDCSITQNGGDDIWDGIVVISGTDTNFDVQIMQNGALVANDFWNNTPFGASNPGLNPDPANGFSTRFLLKVRTSGADIDGRRIIGMTRVFNKTYSEFKINGTERGKNFVPLTFADDNFNQTAIGSMTSSPYSTVAYATQGYVQLDVDNDTVNENYAEEWDLGVATSPQAYERWKYITRTGETTITLKGLVGQLYRGITHELGLSGGAGGPWNAFEPVTWTGGSGQMLAINNTTATSATKMWIQVLTGVAPTSGTITGSTSGASNTVTGATERTLSTPFCGQSTGAALIGSYGLGVTPIDLLSADSVQDLDLTGPYSPPNYATFSVNGLDTAGDVVLVAPRGYMVYYDNEVSGPFTVGETLTFDTAGTPYTAKLNELIDFGTTGIMLIGATSSGVAPTDGHTINGATASADVNGTPTATADIGQLTLAASYTTAGVTSISFTSNVPSDMPQTGTVRIQRDSGIYSRITYSGYSGTTMTITSTDFSTDNASSGNNAFVSLIDKAAASDPEQVTVIYSSDRVLFVRVRDGGVTPKKQVETTGTLGAAGGSVNVNLQSDE